VSGVVTVFTSKTNSTVSVFFIPGAGSGNPSFGATATSTRAPGATPISASTSAGDVCPFARVNAIGVLP